MEPSKTNQTRWVYIETIWGVTQTLGIGHATMSYHAYVTDMAQL